MLRRRGPARPRLRGRPSTAGSPETSPTDANRGRPRRSGQTLRLTRRLVVPRATLSFRGVIRGRRGIYDPAMTGRRLLLRRTAAAMTVAATALALAATATARPDVAPPVANPCLKKMSFGLTSLRATTFA